MEQNLMNEILELKKQIRELDFKLEWREKEKSLKRWQFWTSTIYYSYYVVLAVVVMFLISTK